MKRIQFDVVVFGLGLLHIFFWRLLIKFLYIETIILPGTSLDESSFEFEIEADRNI